MHLRGSAKQKRLQGPGLAFCDGDSGLLKDMPDGGRAGVDAQHEPAVVAADQAGLKGFIGAAVLKHRVAVNARLVGKDLISDNRLERRDGTAGGSGDQTADCKQPAGVKGACQFRMPTSSSFTPARSRE